MSAYPEARRRIRPMLGNDLAQVLRIERISYEFPWTAGNFHDSLRAGYSTWVAEQERQVLAYMVLMLGYEEGHVLNLTVAPEWRRRGIATELLRHAAHTARYHRAEVLFLEVRPSNQGALALYRQMGFSELGVRRRYYPAPDGREDAIVMRLTL